MKKVMILGGGENQIPLILRAKKLGYFIILCDFRNNVEGIKLSDVHYQVNTLDPSQLIEVGKKEHPQGIITNSEPVFMSMAQTAEALGLRCMNMDSTILFKNKFLMREFCKTHNLLYPRYRRCTCLGEAVDFYNEVNGKCIIKPLDNSASRGVYSISDVTDLNGLFEECLKCSSAENHAIIIEEYITGTEFTVDGIMTPNGHRSLAISEKKHYAYNENVACQLLFDNQNENFDYEELRRVNDHLVDLTEISFGLTHAEYKYLNGKFYLIEIQARGGGNFIATDIVPFISGIDEYTEQLKWAVGDQVNVNFSYNSLSERCAVLHFFDIPGQKGIVKSIEGLDLMDRLGDQLIYHLNFKVGDYVREAKDDSARIGWYILKCASRKELDEKMQIIENNFKIII